MIFLVFPLLVAVVLWYSLGALLMVIDWLIEPPDTHVPAVLWAAGLDRRAAHQTKVGRHHHCALIAYNHDLARRHREIKKASGWNRRAFRQRWTALAEQAVAAEFARMRYHYGQAFEEDAESWLWVLRRLANFDGFGFDGAHVRWRRIWLRLSFRGHLLRNFQPPCRRRRPLSVVLAPWLHRLTGSPSRPLAARVRR